MYACFFNVLILFLLLAVVPRSIGLLVMMTIVLLAGVVFFARYYLMGTLSASRILA